MFATMMGNFSFSDLIASVSILTNVFLVGVTRTMKLEVAELKVYIHEHFVAKE